MSHRVRLGRSLPVAGFLALIFAATLVKADEIVYVSPTSSIVSLSDSYIVPTSSIVSTSYLLPTSYVSSSSYVVPSSTVVVPSSTVVATRYVAPATTVYLPRSYIRRTARYGTVVSPTYYLAPTNYLTPTVYLSPTRYVTTTAYSAAACCDPDPCAGTNPPLRAPAPAATKPNNDERVERRPSGSFDEDAETTPTAAQRPKPITSTPANGGNPGGSGVGAVGAGGGVETSSSRPAPAPVSSTPSKPTPPASPTGSPFDTNPRTPVPAASAPAKPADPKPNPASSPTPGGIDPSPPAPNEPGSGLPEIPPPLTKRDSFRPKINDADVNALRSGRNVLQGRVLSAETGEAEEGVAVILSDRRDRFVDRTAKTDALGRFAVSLPEGDWTVKVTMPSGRLYAVGKGDITASAGTIRDEAGREVGTLTIRR